MESILIDIGIFVGGVVTGIGSSYFILKRKLNDIIDVGTDIEIDNSVDGSDMLE